MANLVTDKYLVGLIQKDRRGWVKIRDLLRFNRLRQITERLFERGLNFAQIEHFVAHALRDSVRLKVADDKVKLSQRFVLEK